jgi:hypothetical protein
MVSCNLVSRLKSARNPGGPNEWHQIGATTPAAIATAQDHPVRLRAQHRPGPKAFSSERFETSGDKKISLES